MLRVFRVMRRRRFRTRVQYVVSVVLFGVCLTMMNFIMNNTHLSESFVRKRALLYPAVYNISSTCPWYTKHPATLPVFKPPAFVLMARALTDIYNMHDIMFLLREGSLLHEYRHIPADDDMDMWIIVPKHMTMKQAYDKIEQVLRGNSEYDDITFEYQSLLLVSIIFQYSDTARVSYKGVKLIDINVLHETFINDPELQSPCWKQMRCDIPTDDNVLIQNYDIVLTKNLFQNLCKCPFMETEFFCFSELAGYLKLRYGDDYMRPTARKDFVRPRELIYERPFRIWRIIIPSLPFTNWVRLYFENHDIYKESIERENIVQYYHYVNKTKIY